MVQLRTKLTFVCRLPDNKLTTCGLNAARKDAASTPSIPWIVYCFVNPLIAELVSQISNLFFAILPNMEFTCVFSFFQFIVHYFLRFSWYKIFDPLGKF